MIIEAITAHADETGMRVEERLRWLHAATTELYTYLFVHEKRGRLALESEQFILDKLTGWLVHDCWGSYFNFKELRHALCEAHILRELEGLIENEQSKWGRYKRTKGRNLVERLIREKVAVLAFAFNEEVPFTNNLAERDLRPAKVKLKVSNCFRSFEGAEIYARISSFVSTARKNNRNVYSELYTTFSGHNFLTGYHTLVNSYQI